MKSSESEIKPIHIDEKFYLPLKEFQKLVQTEYTSLIDDLHTESGKAKLERAIDTESQFYTEMQKRIKYNEIITEICKTKTVREFLPIFAGRISEAAVEYYTAMGQPISISVLNRKFGKQWRDRCTYINFNTIVTILCENSYIKFELFGTRSGTKLVVPSLLRRLEGTSDYPNFVYDKMVESGSYIKLTPELTMGYL